MRRSLFAGIGVAAVLIFAACSPDQPRQEPLAPADVGLAKGGGGGGGGGGGSLCSGSVFSAIGKLQASLFTKAQVADVFDPLLTTIRNECPTTSQSTIPSAALMTYIQSVIDYRPNVTGNVGAISVDRAKDLVKLWELVTSYATSAPVLVRSHTVLLTGNIVDGQPGTRGGGADVLASQSGPFYDLEMMTFDQQAGVKIGVGPAPSFPPVAQTPAGPYLITMDPAGCPATTLRLASLATQSAGKPCYEVESWPPVTTTWSPAIAIGMCILESGPTAITHANPNFGTEVLPSGPDFPWVGSNALCTPTHTMLDTWLGRGAGPLGRALARAIDYLRPQPLFAEDAGESGLGLFTSPFGGALTVVFQHGFENPTPTGPLADGTATEVGHPDGWQVVFNHPGFIQVQNGFGGTFGLSSNVVVLSQALGNCDLCPTVALLGTRVNPSETDNIGVYEITWSSLQNKPSVKEAPFVVRAFRADSIYAGPDIAKFAYVTAQGNKQFTYNGQTVNLNGSPLTWAVDSAQHFKITVNLQTVNGQNSYRTSLAVKIGSSYVPLVSNTPFLNADPVTLIPSTTAGKTMTTIGYFLSGIDAGVIAADNFVIKRLADQP